MRLDRLTAVLAVPLLASLALSFTTFRANRIAPGQPRPITEVFGGAASAGLIAALVALIAVLLVMRPPALRAALVALAIGGQVVLVGLAARYLTEGAPAYARVAPGAGFWLGFATLGLLLVDALARLDPSPLVRLLLLAVLAGAVAGLFRPGLLSDLSVILEYRNRADSFWREAGHHLVLAFGSFAAALLIGVPLGVMIARRAAWRPPVLNVLTVVQTVPSIALFGMLIVPLAWISLHVPGAARVGIRGIGTAPAFVALFLYSLLPIVSNTAAGLLGVPKSVAEAADGMGLTRRQRMVRVDIPLALPVILTGARIVLVQNIGLATVGALIGAGGFGVFVFQGVGQTAADLIMLGALPTVALAFLTWALMDVMVALLPGATTRAATGAAR